jgi:hypothetical protein
MLIIEITRNLLLQLYNLCFCFMRAKYYAKQGFCQLHMIERLLYFADAQLTHIKLDINDTVEACFAADCLRFRY